MRHQYTESDFGIMFWKGMHSADGGQTWHELPIADAEFENLCADTANWRDKPLTDDERAFLREMLCA